MAITTVPKPIGFKHLPAAIWITRHSYEPQIGRYLVMSQMGTLDHARQMLDTLRALGCPDPQCKHLAEIDSWKVWGVYRGEPPTEVH